MQEVNLGTASFSCKRRLKCQNVKMLNCIHLHLRFEISSHSCAEQAASILQKSRFFLSFFITTRDIYTKLWKFYDSSVKIKVKLQRTFFVILLRPAVICNPRLFHENKILRFSQLQILGRWSISFWKAMKSFYKFHVKSRS